MSCALVTLSACGAASREVGATPDASGHNDAELVDIHRQRIETLLGANDEATTVDESGPGPAPAEDDAAGGATADPCTDLCAPAHGICESAGVICEVAERNPAMPRFRSDCEWAGQECQHAKAQCTACQ